MIVEPLPCPVNESSVQHELLQTWSWHQERECEKFEGKTTSFTDVQRYTVVAKDAMKTQSNLVNSLAFLISEIQISTMQTWQMRNQLHTYSSTLTFLVRGLCIDLGHVLALFRCDSIPDDASHAS